jgi:hypothetical protein
MYTFLYIFLFIKYSYRRYSEMDRKLWGRERGGDAERGKNLTGVSTVWTKP